MKPAFDAYGDRYDDVMKESIGFLGRQHEFYTRIKAECLLERLRRLYGATDSLRVLDIGCGTGKTDGFLLASLGELCGTDISSASIERARRDHPQVRYEVYDGRRLPFEDSSFDAAFLICVLHHVEPEDRAALVREARRILRPGGAVFIFEHNPFHPLTRLAVARCEFDRDARLLPRREADVLAAEAGFRVADAQYILYLPFQCPCGKIPESWRRRIPLGAQYFVEGVNDAMAAS